MLKQLYNFIDIGANLTDPMFGGIYNGSVKHNGDLTEVLNRAWKVGVDKIIITSGSLDECKESLKLIQNDARLYTTVGCHPTRCSEFETKSSSPDDYLEQLLSLSISNKNVVAIGECGLDYERLNFCPKETQLKYFEKQLYLSEKNQLPMFLHCRAAFQDMFDILKKNMIKIPKSGVIHSFDGTAEEAKAFIDLGFYIGINGCSLKTVDNLNTIKTISNDRILLETDSPWCEIKATHAGYSHIQTKFNSNKKEKFKEGFCVKGRNEPANILQILEVVSKVKEEDSILLAQQIYKNTCKLFNFNQDL